MTSLVVRTVMIGVCLWGGLTLQSGAQGPQERTEPPQKLRHATPGQSIAGIPFDEALQIYYRHEEELRTLTGAVSVGFTADGLVVETSNPDVLPTSVEGLPVIPVPPVDPRAAMGLEEGIPLPSPAAPEPVPPPVVEERPPADMQRECGSEAHWDPKVGRCRRNVPLSIPSPRFLPAPPGVIVLKPDGRREQKEVCPPSFEEVTEYGGWRFCVDPARPEPIPPLWEPPIAGIPYEKALEIHHRYADELMKIPGVTSVGLGLDGIHVSTDNPAIVPSQVEGLPIKIDPPEEVMPMGHTFNNPVRSLHGANESHQDDIEEAVNVAQGTLSTT